jgi:hypothetical protein
MNPWPKNESTIDSTGYIFSLCAYTLIVQAAIIANAAAT